MSAASIERLRMTELLRLLSRQELLGAGQERVVEDLQAGDMTLGGVRLLLKKRYDAAHNKGVSKANPWGEITIGWLQTKATALDVLRLLQHLQTCDLGSAANCHCDSQPAGPLCQVTLYVCFCVSPP